MVDVTGISVTKAQEIEDASIVAGEVNPAGNLVLTNAGGTEFNAGSVIRSPDVQIFDVVGNDTWTKPDGAVMCYFYCIGGGGAGASSNNAGGLDASGSGGGGGGVAEAWVPASLLPSTVNVTVGAGGAPGGAGADGGDGGYSRFEKILRAPGGQGGTSEDGGDPTGAGGGAAGNILSGRGVHGMTAPGQAVPTTESNGALGPGGGGGGTYSSSNTSAAGGSTGGGLNGERGISSPLDLPLPGSGGRGGATQVAVPYALPGEDGLDYGGGGGGGAVTGLPNAQSVGGAGAQGVCVAVSFF